MAFKRKSEKDPQPESVGTVGSAASGSVLVADGPAPASGPAVATKTMPPAYKGRLGDLLIEQNLITAEQLEQALAVQREEGGKLGETLVNMGALDAQALAEGLAGFFGLVVVNLRRENVDPAP